MVSFYLNVFVCMSVSVLIHWPINGERAQTKIGFNINRSIKIVNCANICIWTDDLLRLHLEMVFPLSVCFSSRFAENESPFLRSILFLFEKFMQIQLDIYFCLCDSFMVAMAHIKPHKVFIFLILSILFNFSIVFYLLGYWTITAVIIGRWNVKDLKHI